MNQQPVSLTGYALINAPRWNKGTAFSDEERDVFSLHGLLPLRTNYAPIPSVELSASVSSTSPSACP